MSVYDDLKTTIRSVVKTNGNQEITGSNMQSTLVSMVDTVDGDKVSSSTVREIRIVSEAPSSYENNVLYIVLST